MPPQHVADGTPAPSGVVPNRVARMLLRGIGEMQPGWKRASDPQDLMHAPVMSFDDIDRMRIAHPVERRKARP